MKLCDFHVGIRAMLCVKMLFLAVLVMFMQNDVLISLKNRFPLF